MQSRKSDVIGKHEGPQKNEKMRKEFSKIMAVIAITMWVFVNLFGMAMVIFTMDTSPLMYVIPSVDAVVAIVCSFYYSKARQENMIKLSKIYGVDAGMFESSSQIHMTGTQQYTPAVIDVPIYEDSNIV